MTTPTPQQSPALQQLDKLLTIVRKHLTDVDREGYVEGEDDVVAARDLTTWALEVVKEALPEKMVTPKDGNYKSGRNEAIDTTLSNAKRNLGIKDE